MKAFKSRRIAQGVSQRSLAARADVSFRTIQLLETGHHDGRLSTLEKVSQSLGLPKGALERTLERRLRGGVDSVADISERICLEGSDSWRIHLFNFVDAYRRGPRHELIGDPPDPAAPQQIACLISSTVETLCDEAGVNPPSWCAGIACLGDPWFVAGVESLKALALVHSPLHFRKRNLFVLDNFLERA